jgi:hypothetical protein
MQPGRSGNSIRYPSPSSFARGRTVKGQSFKTHGVFHSAPSNLSIIATKRIGRAAGTINIPAFGWMMVHQTVPSVKRLPVAGRIFGRLST